MPIIPKDPKATYADRLKPHSPIYYCWKGTWATQQQRSVRNLNVKLVEVWANGAKIWSHPSRNPFFWIAGTGQESIWHKLATGTYAQLANAAYAALRSRPAQVAGSSSNPAYTSKGVVPPAMHDTKSLAAQNWATEATLIGYTGANAITWVGNESHFEILQAISKLNSAPSVYYRKGHATIDHKTAGNIGWETGHGTCQFLGNVPEDCIDYS